MQFYLQKAHNRYIRPQTNHVDLRHKPLDPFARRGLKSGISVSLALSPSDFSARDLIQTVNYGVVVLLIILQGLSIRRVVKLTVR